MDRRESINASVYQDIAGILNAKTYSQLIAMQKQINQKIKSGDAVDIGNYWFMQIVFIIIYGIHYNCILYTLV